MLEDVIAERDAIKREVGPLKQLLEKLAAIRDGEREEGDFGSASSGREDDDDARIIYTIVPHELERAEEEDEQIARQGQQEQEGEEEGERRRRRVKLARPRTPEPTGLGMTHHLPLEDAEEPPQQPSPPNVVTSSSSASRRFRTSSNWLLRCLARCKLSTLL